MDCGLCVQNVTCIRRKQRWYEMSQELTNICFIEKFPVNDPRTETFSFRVDYKQPSAINWVEFAATAGKYFVENTTIVEYVPNDIFVTFPNLKKFVMATNIRELNPGDFNHTKSLVELRLSYNKIKIIRNGVFSQPSPSFLESGEPFRLEFLEEIYLDNNEISEIEPNSFSGLVALTAITLERNNLSVINERSFVGLPHLATLVLTVNSIETIEDGALNLPRLRILDLSSNKLVRLSDAIFSQMPQLKYLNLDENKIKRLSDTVFGRVPKLHNLRLKYNNLEHIGQSLYGLPNVYEILLKGNQIEDLDLVAVAKMPRLGSLDLAESGFTFATVNITEYSYSPLKKLDISKNNLSSAIELNKLLMFPNVKRLTLDGNSFKDLEVGGNRTLKDIMPSLETVYTYRVDLSCEYLLAIEGRYKSLDVYISSLRYMAADCPASIASTLLETK